MLQGFMFLRVTVQVLQRVQAFLVSMSELITAMPIHH
ncbi:hypothetical protein P368_10045 [Comamonas thiooxydans]|nr:hypothetical protein P368_10045 [Comamonas thiooxydans]